MNNEPEIIPGSDEEFAAMQALVAELRAQLPTLTPKQYDLVGLYILSALYLGRGQWKYNDPIKRYLARGEISARPDLRVVK
jgi:hypothetical protein